MKSCEMSYSPYDRAGNFTRAVFFVVLATSPWAVAATLGWADSPVQDAKIEISQEKISQEADQTKKITSDKPEEPRAADGQQRVRLEKDQRFSEQTGKAGLCDVYFPASDPPVAGYPVVVVIHGGGWVSGDKWTIASYSRLLAKEGIVAVAINYRLAPNHKFPAQVDDVRSAMLWVNQNAKRLRLNVRQVGLFGYSAGGHLSALLASLADEPLVVRAAASNWPISDPRWQKLPKICAVCAGGPPCDFRSLPIDNSAMAYFLGGSRREKPEAYIAASPAAHVSVDDPVTQLFHGEGDALVPLAGTRQFHESQVSAGIDSRLAVIPKQGHMLTFISPKTYQTVVDFFREVLLKPVVVSPK
jgi:acetyl esterase/lipase